MYEWDLIYFISFIHKFQLKLNTNKNYQIVMIQSSLLSSSQRHTDKEQGTRK